MIIAWVFWIVGWADVFSDLICSSQLIQVLFVSKFLQFWALLHDCIRLFWLTGLNIESAFFPTEDNLYCNFCIQRGPDWQVRLNSIWRDLSMQFPPSKCTYMAQAPFWFFPIFFVQSSFNVRTVLSNARFEHLLKSETLEVNLGWTSQVVAGVEEGITQVASVLPGSMAKVVWNFPLEMTLKSTNVFGWPQLVLSVHGTDFWWVPTWVGVVCLLDIFVRPLVALPCRHCCAKCLCSLPLP